jgi:hypothetical protein
MKLILYSNKTSNFQALSNTLFKLGQSNEPQKIHINDKTFYKYFSIAHSMRSIKTDKIETYVDEIRD